MAFDKSKDYLKQTVKTSAWYWPKSEEGARANVTNSVREFQNHARLVQHVVIQSVDRTSPDWSQEDTCTVYVWREPWLVEFTADRLPALSDRLLVGGYFWTVTEVNFTDMDDSGLHQRFKLSCTRSKGRAKP